MAIDDVKIKAKGLFQYESIFILLLNTKNENPHNPRHPFHHHPHARQAEEIPFLAPFQVE
jgi:hypothetical protein